MSDFGKECAKEWRDIKKIYEGATIGTTADKSVREQIVTDMNKNIERHENAPAPKAWPVRTQDEGSKFNAWLEWLNNDRRRCNCPARAVYPCPLSAVECLQRSLADVHPGC